MTTEETMTDAIETPEIEQSEPLTIEDIEAILAEQFPLAAPVEPFAGDNKATWHYWSDMDTVERGVPTEWIWERLRNRRDALLAECDWRVVPGCPVGYGTVDCIPASPTRPDGCHKRPAPSGMA